jgi:small subunit ribosomal protein S20
MPNTKTAKKQLLVSQRNHARNLHNKSVLKTALKNARAAIEAGENRDEAKQALDIAVKTLQRSVTKRIIKKPTASRYTSRMMKSFNAKFGEVPGAKGSKPAAEEPAAEESAEE